MKGRTPNDPKALIFEAYRIENITPAECRSIFLDWALGIPDPQTTNAALRDLIERYGNANPDHPMTKVLHDGLSSVATPRRRGGWRSRRPN